MLQENNSEINEPNKLSDCVESSRIDIVKNVQQEFGVIRTNANLKNAKEISIINKSCRKYDNHWRKGFSVWNLKMKKKKVF